MSGAIKLTAMSFPFYDMDGGIRAVDTAAWKNSLHNSQELTGSRESLSFSLTATDCSITIKSSCLLLFAGSLEAEPSPG